MDCWQTKLVEPNICNNKAACSATCCGKAGMQYLYCKAVETGTRNEAVWAPGLLINAVHF